MKFIPLLFFISTALCAKTKSITNISGNNVVTLFSNGYVTPVADVSDSVVIDETGLHKWSSEKQVIKTYALFTTKGKVNISINARSPVGNSIISVSVGNKKTEVRIPKSADFKNISIGMFDINETGYVHIDMQGVKKSGVYFPDVASFVLSGDATEGLKHNKSEYRGAASTHLRYKIQEGDDVEWFYNEIKVPAGYDNLNAYYMVNGFSGGYFGIQVNSPTERRILFALWSNYNTDNPTEIPSEYAVKLLKNGSNDILSEPFGGEGSGGHSYLKFN